MRAKPRLLLLLAGLPLALALAVPPADAPRNKREAGAMFSEDGLEKVAIKGIDVAYVRPGARLSEYRRVLLKPITVSFRRDWDRSGGMAGVRARPEDMERIRTRLSGALREAFEKELQAAGIGLATEPGDDVMELGLAITDLYAAAPAVQTAGRTEVYAVSAGEMTLVADVRDSVSGESELRFYDHGTAREYTRMHRIMISENETEAKRITAEWAAALRKQLESARGTAPAAD